MDDIDGMESPIDSLLEQIKRGTRVMDDRQQTQSTVAPKVRRSRSGASVLSTDTDNLISDTMEQVDAAEKEASEVLHSLLSVERIEKQNLVPDTNQQVVVVTATEAKALNPDPTNSGSTDSQDQNAIQWHTPVTVHHTLFANMVGVNNTLSGDQVIWQFNQDSLNCQQQNNIYVPENTPENNVACSETPSFSFVQQSDVRVESKGTKQKNSKVTEKSSPKKKLKPVCESPSESTETSRLEESAQQVRERFEKGCECQEENCFVGLNPEYVYRHRLNIAELTKGEHDMYLMGVTMAVLTNPEETVRHKERRRLRAQYVFQGRRVCLDAFLYLENCTHYQLKRIRKHVMTHGVAPRVHGNHGKKPHNTFPLHSYRHAAAFLREYVERNTSGCNTQQLYLSCKTKNKASNKSIPLYLPAEITRKTIHNAYREFCERFEPSIKVMGYSTFRQYMKEQFPHVKFCKSEGTANKLNSNQQQQQIQQHQHQQQPQQQQQQQQQVHQEECLQENSSMAIEIVSPQSTKLEENILTTHTENLCHDTRTTTLISATSDVQQVTAIPIVLSQTNTQTDVMNQSAAVSQTQSQQPTAYIVTPVSQILHSPLSSSHGISNHSGGTFTSYQLTSANPNDYPTQQHMNQAQVGTITVTSVPSNVQPGSYAFTTL